jgi:hypothetical protein
MFNLSPAKGQGRTGQSIDNVLPARLGFLRQQAKGHKVVGEVLELAIDHVKRRSHKAFPRLLIDAAHHSKVKIAQSAVRHAQNVPGVGVGVVEALLQHLLQRAAHANLD